MSKLSLEDVITHPVTGLTAIGTSAVHVLSLGPLDALAGVIWMQIATLFTATSIAAFTVVPNVYLGPLEPLAPAVEVLAIVLGVLYVAKLGDRFINQVQQRL